MDNMANVLRPALCQYEVGKVANGWLFGTYDALTGNYSLVYADTPEKLGELITNWQADRVKSMIEYLKSL